VGGQGGERNEPCVCGSGKKFKKCCLLKEKSNDIVNQHVQVEPHLYIVPSTVWQGKRIRAIWDKIFFQELNETFHEFLILVAYKDILGKEFHHKQLQLEDKEKHVTFKWWMSFCQSTHGPSKAFYKDGYGMVMGRTASGNVKSLLQLAYDLFCLQAINQLPSSTIKKLIDMKQYQGTRYEVAITSIMVRAGFKVEFLDDIVKDKIHCEFIAEHKETGQKIGIEAKSRQRPGVLNREGIFNPDEHNRGDIGRLFWKARSQKPGDMPYIIFIDVNLPHTPDTPLEKKGWFEEVKLIYQKYRENAGIEKDPFNALILTNYSYYYSGDQDTPDTNENYVILSENPEYELRRKIYI
jgi:hypothetical protein